MRFLHCSDLHLGKQMRGHSRHGEHEAVLEQITDIAASECVDAVLIAGDVFDSPGAQAAYGDDSERLFLDWCIRLRGMGMAVVVIGGNHDSARRLDAWAGLARLGGIHIIGAVPEDPASLVVHLPGATIVGLPWVPERYVRSWESLSEQPGMQLSNYSANVGAMLQRAGQLFDGPGPRILLFHGYLSGAALTEDSGERTRHGTRGFAVRPFDLPGQAHYVALGHIHRPQQIASHVPAYYSGRRACGSWT